MGRSKVFDTYLANFLESRSFFYYLATDDMLKRGSQLNFQSWALYFIYFLSTITFKTRNETNIVWPRGLFDSDKNFLSSAGKMIVSIGIEAITEN